MPDKKSPATKTRSRRAVDPQTKKRIHEHLTNKNDQVSEEDIRNVKTDVTEGLPNADSPEEEGIKDNTDPEVETPWNMLET